MDPTRRLEETAKQIEIVIDEADLTDIEYKWLRDAQLAVEAVLGALEGSAND